MWDKIQEKVQFWEAVKINRLKSKLRKLKLANIQLQCQTLSTSIVHSVFSMQKSCISSTVTRICRIAGVFPLLLGYNLLKILEQSRLAAPNCDVPFSNLTVERHIMKYILSEKTCIS